MLYKSEARLRFFFDKVYRENMAFEFKVSGTYEDFMKNAPDKVDKAFDMASKDFPSRVRPKVRSAVKASYPGVRAGDISAAVSSSHGGGKEAVQSYKGGVLSVSHFGMSPKQMPSARQSDYWYFREGIPWNGTVLHRLRQPAPYSISFTIKGGTSLPEHGGYFVWNGNAFHRNGKSIEKVNTLSVPAMIWNDAKPQVEEDASQVYADRVWHHLEQTLN